jgi:MFS family permease
VPETRTGTHLLLLAISNFLGPLLLAAFFDTIGRRVMISLTYAAGGALLIAAALIFGFNGFYDWTQTFALMLVFFFGSVEDSKCAMIRNEKSCRCLKSNVASPFLDQLDHALCRDSKAQLDE